MELREEFVLRALDRDCRMAQLCREYGISRKTGYKWLERFKEKGLIGLEALSRRPERSPLAADANVVAEVVRLRVANGTWGPRKLAIVMSRSSREVPSVRTIARILERSGLIERTRRVRVRNVMRPMNRPSSRADNPNDLWTIDFKGWWHTKDGRRCEPLTVRDAASRFVLELKVLPSTREDRVRKRFERLFKRYGLPKAMLMDNGTPFISMKNPLGLTTLSAWWNSLGIEVRRSRVGRPQDNGGHERMHRDIAEDLQPFAKLDERKQQEACDRWRHVFNHHRPHEALGMKTPGELYRPSTTRFTGRPIEFVYPEGYQERTVDSSGHIKISGQSLFVSEAIRGNRVGLEPVGNSAHRVWFFTMLVGWIRQKEQASGRFVFEWATAHRLQQRA